MVHYTTIPQLVLLGQVGETFDLGWLQLGLRWISGLDIEKPRSKLRG